MELQINEHRFVCKLRLGFLSE